MERDIMDLKQEFRTLRKYHQENDFEKILTHEHGIYFLKMRSISRSSVLKELAEKLKIDISGISGRDLFELMFCKKIPNEELNEFIKQIYKRERKKRISNEDYLYCYSIN